MPSDIRPFTADHAAELRELYLHTRRATFFWVEPATLRLEDFDVDTQDEPILVAIENDQIIGFVSWWPPENFIHNLFVDPLHQGRGIGQQLLNACLQQIGRPATLKCAQPNARALGFYQKQGWQFAGEGSTNGTAYFLLRLDS